MEKMVINIKSSITVQPSQETPKGRLWLSNLDHVVSRIYIPTIYFYRSNGLPGFFDPNLVKEALGRALIQYYPVAGRLTGGADGRRIEIDCNEQGVLFVEAETKSVVDDFGDFAPTAKYRKLFPKLESSSEISASPLLLVQVTHFKCGGVSVAIAMYHILVDAFSIISFINTWADMARGLDPTTSPYVDRTLLLARDPPSPKFLHVEYQPSPTLLTPRPTSVVTCTRAFSVTRDQINTLKENAKEDGKMSQNYTSFEILSGHIWRCVCKARGLSNIQESKLYIPVDTRSRLQPNLPSTFFGNAIFMTCSVATVGDIVSNPASDAANKIHESVRRMDDEYLRSALDCVELQLDGDVLVRGSHTCECPNLAITSWARLPIYDADFGWGRPTYVGLAWVDAEGFCYLVPRATDGGGMLVFITLEDKYMSLFETYLYNFELDLCCCS